MYFFKCSLPFGLLFLLIVCGFENNINTIYSISTLIPVGNYWKFNFEIKLNHSNNDTNQVLKNVFTTKTLVDKWIIPMNSKSSTSKISNNITDVGWLASNHNNTHSKVIAYLTSFTCNPLVKSKQTLVDKWTIPINSKSSTVKTNYVSDVIQPINNHNNTCSNITEYPTYYSCNSLLKSKQIEMSKASKFTHGGQKINTQIWYNTNLRKNVRITKQYCTSFKYFPVRKSLTSAPTYYRNSDFKKYCDCKPINYKRMNTKKYIDIAKYSNYIKTDRFWHVTTTEINRL